MYTAVNPLREAHLHAGRPRRGFDLTAVRPRNRLEWANAHIRWRLASGFHCGQMADSVYGIMWVSGLLMSKLWIEWPMVAAGLWSGQVYVTDNEHRCTLLMAVTRS